MRSMGQNPTEDEVLNLVIGIDPQYIVVSLRTFKYFMKNSMSTGTGLLTSMSSLR